MTTLVEVSPRACLSLSGLTCAASFCSASRFKETPASLQGFTNFDRIISSSFVGAHPRSPRLPTHLNTKAASSSSGAAAAADVDGDLIDDGIADDYYAVLGVSHDATPEEIKKAYYSCMKACHPDLAGENTDTTTFCMFINEVYEVLSDPVQRMVYDEINGYSLISVNPFLDLAKPREHIFVDEFSCIGCKNCANTAPKTFEIEEDFGRARVASQCGRTPAAQQAIDTCPVDCIHWVTAAQLSMLEDEMRRTERVNVGVMLSGMGRMSSDVFSSASRRWEKKQARAVEAAKIRMMREKNKDFSGPWWQNLWNQSPDGTDPENPVDPAVQERAAKAAAAARRWREYSRKGADRRPIYNLPINFTLDAEQKGEKSEEKTSK
eukprot:c15649_g1_i1 orf=395-1531(-)